MQRSGDDIGGGCGGSGGTPASACPVSADWIFADALWSTSGKPGGLRAVRSGLDSACASVDSLHRRFRVAYRARDNACADRTRGYAGGRNEQRGLQENHSAAQQNQRGLWFFDRGLRGENHGVFSFDRGLHGENHGVFSFDRGLRGENRGVFSFDCGLRGDNHGVSSLDRGLRGENHGVFSLDRGLHGDNRGVFSFDRGLHGENHGVSSLDRGLRGDNHGVFSFDHGLGGENRGVFSFDHAESCRDHSRFYADGIVPAELVRTTARARMPACHARVRGRAPLHPSRPGGCARHRIPTSHRKTPIGSRIERVATLLSRRRGVPSGSSHARCPKPGFRCNVFG
jgi:hypothetical protein